MHSFSIGRAVVLPVCGDVLVGHGTELTVSNHRARTNAAREAPLFHLPIRSIYAGLPAIRQSVRFGGRMGSSLVTETLLPPRQAHRQLCHAQGARPRSGWDQGPG